jgi:hypothetical protein
MMKLADILPALHELPRADKFRVVQYLASELAREEGVSLGTGEYPVWSPHSDVDAAHTLTQYLREQSPPR